MGKIPCRLKPQTQVQLCMNASPWYVYIFHIVNSIIGKRWSLSILSRVYGIQDNFAYLHRVLRREYCGKIIRKKDLSAGRVFIITIPEDQADGISRKQFKPARAIPICRRHPIEIFYHLVEYIGVVPRGICEPAEATGQKQRKIHVAAGNIPKRDHVAARRNSIPFQQIAQKSYLSVVIIIQRWLIRLYTKSPNRKIRIGYLIKPF